MNENETVAETFSVHIVYFVPCEPLTGEQKKCVYRASGYFLFHLLLTAFVCSLRNRATPLFGNRRNLAFLDAADTDDCPPDNRPAALAQTIGLGSAGATDEHSDLVNEEQRQYLARLDHIFNFENL